MSVCISITKLNFTFHVCVITNNKNVSGIDIISERNIKGTDITSKTNVQRGQIRIYAEQLTRTFEVLVFYKILCIQYTLG